MITIEISSVLHVTGLSEIHLELIKKDLTIPNKAYLDAIKYGRYISPTLVPELIFYQEMDDYIIIPKGYIHPLVLFLRQNKQEYELIDNCLLLEPIDFPFFGEPREYQSNAVKDLKKYPVGILEAATGAGKTFTAIKMIAVRKQKTLVIVHTKELLYQWIDSVKKFMGIEAGIVGDGKFEVQDITIGIINSIRNRTGELRDLFGHIIIDESHRTPSSTWTETLVEFNAKYVLGLSATPFREDGLTKALFIFIGPKMHIVDQQHLNKIGAVLKPKITFVESRFNCPSDIEYSSKIKLVTSDTERNKGICNLIHNDLKKYNKPILVVSDRVKHCKELQEILMKHNIESEVLSGGTKKSERTRIVNDMKSNRVKVTFATMSLICEGFDAPGLHALILTTPIKHKGRLKQVCGRVLRPEEGKTPRIYDIQDNFVFEFRNHGTIRRKIYKEEKWLS